MPISSIRVTVPRRWVPISLMRGVVNAITDPRLERDREFGQLVLEIESQAHGRAGRAGRKVV